MTLSTALDVAEPGLRSRTRRTPPDDRHAARIDLAMQRYAGGDAAAFGELYRAIAPPLYRLCLRLSGRDDDANDILQDAFLRLHRARASYVPGSPTLRWAFAIARSSYMDRLRRRRSRPEATVDIDAVEREPAAPSACPESDLCARDMQLVVDRELADMPEASRRAYLLRWRDGLSVTEVAEATGTCWRTARQRILEAHERIEDALRDAGWSVGANRAPTAPASPVKTS